MLTQAISTLLALGVAVFPLPAGAKRAPLGWHQLATTDPAVVALWPADVNIGVACRPSQVVGLDLDRKDNVDGADTFRVLCAAARRPWPSTFTVTTAHGGLHLYFHAPDGASVPSSIGHWPGIDVRAPGQRFGGYLVGPGSTVDGNPYTITRDLPIRDLPAWLSKRLGFATAH